MTSATLDPSPPLDLPEHTGSVAIEVGGMTCASCVAHVEKAVRAVPGVTECQVNLARGRASVKFDPATTDPEHIARSIIDSGYQAVLADAGMAAATAEEQRLVRQTQESQAWFRRAWVGIVLWLPLELTHWVLHIAGSHVAHLPALSTWMGWASLICSTIAMVYVGGRFYVSAWAALRHRTSNMDILISMGASVAYGYSLAYVVGGIFHVWPPPMLQDLYFMEAGGLLALISLGHWLEARARQSAGSAIRELLQLTPDVALRFVDEQGAFEEVAISAVHVGDRLLIRPGDRVPIDGVVVEGRSSVDESMITGEPIPVTRSTGDSVIGGTINVDGKLTLRVTKTGAQTALAQIVNLVESAQSDKPPVQQLADQISAVFVPSVLGIALVTGIGWYIWGSHHGWPAGETWSHVARAVCSVLIIACPCALGLAVPTTVMVGTGRGARRGILIRDMDALQKAEKIDTVVLDKTGTLTQGKPLVTEIRTLNGMGEDEVLRLAASAEQFSSHPLGKAVVTKARERGLTLSEVDGFSNEAGAGVTAQVDGKMLLVGSESLLISRSRAADGNAVPSAPPMGTSIHVATIDATGIVTRLGVISIADELKPDSIAAVAELKRLGLRTVLLTGDNRAAADKIAAQLQIDDVRADMKPADKGRIIAELQNRGAGGKSHVAMVGDGINDAPALAAADLGIAIGGGSDIAKEAGDIVLISGSVSGVAVAIRLSRATMRKIRQNLFLAFVYNVIAIPLAAFGLLNPLIAAAAMALSDVTVVGNALLLRRAKIDE